MKKLISVIFTLAAASIAFAQNSSLSDPDPTIIGADSAKQALREISVDKFEIEGSWNASISPDFGVISSRLFDGSPAMKEPVKGEEEAEDSKVLGVKVEFFRRGVNSFFVRSARPIPIEGVTKTVSVWVAGRNMGHSLYLLVQDYFGNNFELYMGNLVFYLLYHILLPLVLFEVEYTRMLVFAFDTPLLIPPLLLVLHL